MQNAIRTQAKFERPKNKTTAKKKVLTSTGKSHADAGTISEHKLSEIMQGSIHYVKANKGVSDLTKAAVTSTIDFNNNNKSSIDDAAIDNAVKKLIELNKDKLTESQLVDLLASFYFVTNQCFSKNKPAAPKNLDQVSDVTTALKREESQEAVNQNASRGDEYVDWNCRSGQTAISSSSLRERKQQQWMHEREELAQLNASNLSEQRLTNDCVSRKTVQNSSGRKMSSMGGDFSEMVASTSVRPDSDGHPTAVNHGQPMMMTKSYSGFSIGEDPKRAAEIKEQQRLAWIAELDRQVEEKKTFKAREREDVNRQDINTSLPPTPVYLSKPSDAEEAPRIPHVVTAFTSNPDHSAASETSGNLHLPDLSATRYQLTTTQMVPSPPTNSENFARGRGLADLEGRLDVDAFKRRQRQLELQAGFEEQMREQALRRREEKVRLEREELEEMRRIEEQCQQQRLAAETEQKRKREAEMALAEEIRERELRRREEKARLERVEWEERRRAEQEQRQLQQESIAEEYRKRQAEANMKAAMMDARERALKKETRGPTAKDRPADILKISYPKQNRRSSEAKRNGVVNEMSHRRAEGPCTPPSTTNARATKLSEYPTYDRLTNRSTNQTTVGDHRKTFNWKGVEPAPIKSTGRTKIKSGVIAPTDFGDAVSQKNAIQSTLLPASSNFLAAIEDPDYMYYDESSPPLPSVQPPQRSHQKSALEQVSQIKKSLMRRQQELQSMQREEEG